MSKNAVVLEGIFYELNRVNILEDINLAIKENEFLAIIGPNGGGKSTLLKIILGLLMPQKGTVKVFGQSPKNTLDKIGYLPQVTHFKTDFPINVFEVVLMGRYNGPLKNYSSKDEESVIKALENVNMLDYREQQIGRLSGGQLQRVLIARALSREPKLLLLDEPTASIDPKMQTDFYELLSKIKTEMAVVLVSHDVGVVSTYVENIACLNRRLFSHGPVETAVRGLEEAYNCPIDLIAHGIPHRVLREH
jgi:zinc transport system ATP-binding protein